MVTVIIALVGLGGALIRPITSLTSTITRLSTVVERLGTELKEMGESNHKAHARIWAKNEEQDGRLDEHDRRLDCLENKRH